MIAQLPHTMRELDSRWPWRSTSAQLTPPR